MSSDRADRSADHLRKAANLDRERAREARQALALLAQFVEQAQQRGLEPDTLTARSYDGATRYRTDVRGWYLKRDRSVAVSVTGTFHVMSTPRSLSSRFKGVSIPPSDPPMELGRGARDGESIPLPDALANRLEAGDNWP